MRAGWRWLWALPCSLLGGVLALPLLALGGTARRVDGTLEVAWRPTGNPRLRFTALTLGHVIVGASESELERLRVHERAHVHQFERWGPLLLVAYPLASVIAWWRGEGAYWGNRFEREARAAEATLPSLKDTERSAVGAS